MIEYWRWWVVHLWVEGFFEVFATAVIALLFLKLGLVRAKVASIAVLFSAIIFLSGGIIGTLHHLYWSGTPASVMALGAVVSALEVVPLVLLGLEGYHNYRFTRTAPWVAAYRWPILFFVGVAFWNMLGAGVFGFLINPPISLYYIQGLNTTAVHAHAALFGVYGLLGIGLMLFCLRGMTVNDGLGRPAAEVGLLGPEHRPGDDAVPVAAADRHHPGLGLGRPRLLVRPLGRRGAVAAGPHPGVDARPGRHRLRRSARLLIGIFALKLWLGSRGRVPLADGSRKTSPLAAE